jgi:uncharacterized membrane protein YphA (DoxX/SURF4 family)
MSTEGTIEQNKEYPSALHTWVPRVIEGLIGAVLLIAGYLKALDILGFSQQIAAFKIVTDPVAVKVLAWLFISIELVLGASLLVGLMRRIMIPAAVVLMIVFLVVLGWAWYTGATADCGCFGAWVKRTPQQALIEDLLMLVGLAVAWALNRRSSYGARSIKLAIVLILTIIGLGVGVVKSRSPEQANDPVARLQAANQQSPFLSLSISDLPVDVRQGNYLVALIDTGCDHCQASVPKFNEIYEKKDNLPAFAAICPNSPTEIKIFQKQYGAKFPMGRISDDDFKKLLERGTTPRIFLLKEGAIEKIWDGVVPSEAEVKSAIK